MSKRPKKRVITIELTGLGHPKFYELLEEIGKLHDKKQGDYGTEDDPFANLNEAKEFGVSPWKNLVTGRMTDKWFRIKNITRKGYALVKDESLRDAFRDLAVYSLIAIILKEDEDNQRNK